MTNATFADFIRRIQHLTHKPNKAPIEVQELEFYKSIYKILDEGFNPNSNRNLVPFNLKGFPFSNAQSLAHSLGLHLVQGGSGTVYLSWAKGVDRM